MERDCESELSKLNIEQNACIYHFGASVIHGQRSNILRLQKMNYFVKTMAGSFSIVVLFQIYRQENREKLWTKSYNCKRLETSGTETVKKRMGEVGT